MTLIKESAKQNVKRFIMVSSLGTTKFGLPASLLNLFWGVLYWKQQAENELIRSGMLYTIVRPGGMERPTDSYKDTHNTVIYPRDSMFSGQISRLQVCSLHITYPTQTPMHSSNEHNCLETQIPAVHVSVLLSKDPVQCFPAVPVPDGSLVYGQ